MTRFGAALASCLLMVLLASTPSAGQEAAGGGEEAGELAFNNACRTCHTVKEGDNRLGPSLFGVVGRKAGSLPDYAFSPALTNSGITWDEASLDRFIENPDAVAPGNNMKPYTGMSDQEERARIVAYLKGQAQ
jgi:cytochrome c